MTGTDHLDREPQRTTAPIGGEFRSILFGGGDSDLSQVAEPPFFTDLNLDQVVQAIVAGRGEYDLKPFFYLPLRDEATVVYRQEVFRDLETREVAAAVRTFAKEMQQLRRYLTLAEKQRFGYEKKRWFLDAAATYCRAVSVLAGQFAELELRSRGCRGLRDYLSHYSASEQFASLTSDVDGVLAGLGAVRYTLRIRGARVTVGAYDDEADYSVEVEETFARFRETTAVSHLVKLPDSGSEQITMGALLLAAVGLDALSKRRDRP